MNKKLDAVGKGFSELAIDFKRYFTIPPDEVRRRLDLETPVPGSEAIRARRRSVFMSPYLEHLSTRFAQYFSRVALPEQHQSE